MPANNPGASGTTVIEYRGGNHGNETYVGPITGTPYIFSVKKNRRRVANEDLHHVSMSGKGLGLLDLRDSHKKKPLFVKIIPPGKAIASPPPVVKEPEEVISGAPVVEEAAVFENGAKLTDLPGVGATTAKKLEEAGVLSPGELIDTEPEYLAEAMGWSIPRVEKLLGKLEE